MYVCSYLFLTILLLFFFLLCFIILFSYNNACPARLIVRVSRLYVARPASIVDSMCPAQLRDRSYADGPLHFCAFPLICH